MLGKIVASAVSLILVVGVVFGVVAVVNHHSQSSNGSKTNSENLSSQVKLVNQMCDTTTYKDACTKTLGAVNSTDPKEFVKAAILATSEAVKKSFNFSQDLIVKASSEPQAKRAVDDCKELLDQAVQQLQASFSTVGDSNMHTMNQRVAELMSWLSSVIAYQETCVDGFPDNSTMKPFIVQGMVDASHLTDNVLAILSGLADILKTFDLKINIPNVTHNRRLFSVGSDGYPTWMSGADRKLLNSANNAGLKPDAVVAKDGSGQFKTITDALAAYKPEKNSKGRYVIYVKAGKYQEYVTVTKKQKNVFIYGDGPTKTIVTGNRSYNGGYGTWKSATFVVEGAPGFIAKSMGFENTAGPEGHQAVAIRVNSDMAVLYNCRFDGFQDTLLYQAMRQFYRNCVITGTIDFIFGYGAAVIQDSLIIVRKPMANQLKTLVVTADGRKEGHQPTGVVLHNCKIVPEEKLTAEKLAVKAYLGRPWKPYSRTVVMESELPAIIQPEGWMPWPGKDEHLKTLYYAEYANTGPGAPTNQRVKWDNVHVLNKDQALKFTTAAFLKDTAWIDAAEVPVTLGLKKA